MIRFAVTTLLVLSFAVILDSRGADATAISADVYLSQFCAGCALLTNDTGKTDLDFLRSNETTPQDFTACRYHGKLYCKNFDDSLLDETETEITIRQCSARIGNFRLKNFGRISRRVQGR